MNLWVDNLFKIPQNSQINYFAKPSLDGSFQLINDISLKSVYKMIEKSGGQNMGQYTWKSGFFCRNSRILTKTGSREWFFNPFMKIKNQNWTVFRSPFFLKMKNEWEHQKFKVEIYLSMKIVASCLNFVFHFEVKTKSNVMIISVQKLTQVIKSNTAGFLRIQRYNRKILKRILKRPLK